MAVESTSRPRWVLPGVVGAVVLVFVIAGAATQGVGGALAMLGMAALLLGAGPAIAAPGGRTGRSSAAGGSPVWSRLRASSRWPRAASPRRRPRLSRRRPR